MAVKHWNEVKTESITENDLLMKVRALAEKKQKKSVWGLCAKNSEKAVVGVVEPPKRKSALFSRFIRIRGTGK